MRSIFCNHYRGAKLLMSNLLFTTFVTDTRTTFQQGASAPCKMRTKTSSILSANTIKRKVVILLLTILFTQIGLAENMFITTPQKSQAELDEVISRWYDTWKTKYLRPGCQDGEYRIKADAYGNYTVSEAQGYGLVLTAMMAWYDPEAQKLFDGLYQYAAAHPSMIVPSLMAWAQDENCNDKDGAGSATDGDLDIAYALLAADAIWGSTGNINYQQEAIKRIEAIKQFNINPETLLVNFGDWVGSSSTYFYGTRSSDWRIGHFRAYAKVTQDPFWTEVLEAHLKAIEEMQQNFSAQTGLLPDFIYAEEGEALKPARPNFLEADTDNSHSWNACRDPWFIAADAITSGDPRTQKAAAAMSAWIRQAANGQPEKIVAGYRLDGSALVDYTSLAFTAPFATAATQDTDQAWTNALWDHLEQANGEGYYEDSIVVLSLLPITGHWWSP
jgi:endoglucanase